jgi:peptidoglycan/LPS O-acetylase OafA/YrhL
MDRKIEDIQALRAIAILLVLAEHLTGTALLWLRDLPRYTMPFWSGVALFFVISGDSTR